MAGIILGSSPAAITREEVVFAGGLLAGTNSTGKPGAFNRSMQHHLRTNLDKDGVYDPTETVETFFRSEDRHLASMGFQPS